jgi:hypothetical protein
VVVTRQRQLLVAAILVALVAGGLLRRMSQPPTLDGDRETVRSGPTVSRGVRTPADTAVAVIDGFVRDDVDAPLAGARVCAYMSSLELPSEMVRDPLCAKSDVRGHYVIVPTLPSTIQLGAMAKDHEPATSEPSFTMQPGEHRHVDLVARRGGVELSGIVSDIGGGPIAGARIIADGLMAETDDAGRYTLWLSSTWHMVLATAPGYASASRTGEAPMQMDFKLEPGATLSGTIVDASNQPVEGVRVVAISTDAYEHNSNIPAEVGFTDGLGRFSIDRLSPGHYVATAYASHGYGTSEPTLVAIGRPADTIVRLAPAHQVTGRIVVGAARTPCTAGSVTLRDESRGVSVPVVEQADGTVRADGVLPGTYYPLAGCARAQSLVRQDPIIVADRDVEAVWHVGEAAAIRGRVRDKQGTFVPRANVRAVQIDLPPRADVASGTTLTASHGDYVIDGLQPGRYRVTVTAPDGWGSGVTAEETVDVPATGAERDLVVRNDLASVRGTVTTRGAPAKGVWVRVEGEHLVSSLDTDDRGAFQAKGLDPGHYTLTVSNRGGTLPLVSGPHEVDLVASASMEVSLGVDIATGAIRGRVVEGGHAVSDAFVAFTLEDPDSKPGRGYSDVEVAVAADGSFIASDLAAGDYAVRARRKGVNEVLQRHVALGSSVVLELPPAGAIAITSRRDGVPVDDVAVSLTRLDDQSQVRYDQRIGVNGEIELRDVAPGRYALAIAEHDAQARREITVVAGETASVAIDLESRVTVVGRLVDAHSRRPIPYASVVVSPEVGAMVGPMMSSGYITDDNGRFEVEHIPRGTLAVTTQLPDDTMQSTTARYAIPHGGFAGEVIDLGELRAMPVLKSVGHPGVTLSVDEVPGAPALVSSIDPEGPAARAGLVVGDVITAVDGIDVTGSHSSETSVLLFGVPGSTIEVTLARGVTVAIALDE